MDMNIFLPTSITVYRPPFDNNYWMDWHTVLWYKRVHTQGTRGSSGVWGNSHILSINYHRETSIILLHLLFTFKGKEITTFVPVTLSEACLVKHRFAMAEIPGSNPVSVKPVAVFHELCTC